MPSWFIVLKGRLRTVSVRLFGEDLLGVNLNEVEGPAKFSLSSVIKLIALFFKTKIYYNYILFLYFRVFGDFLT